jgi:hypothetical protein
VEHLIVDDVERVPHPVGAPVRRVGQVPRAAAGRAADEERDEGPPPPVHPPGLTASASPRVEGLGNGDGEMTYLKSNSVAWVWVVAYQLSWAPGLSISWALISA